MTRRIWAVLAALALVGCSTVKPIEAPPEELRRLILEESLISNGDRVSLVTADGKQYRFRVTDIDLASGTIRGGDEEVAIENVIAVQTKEVAVGRTAALAAGIYVGVGFIIAISLPVLVLTGL